MTNLLHIFIAGALQGGEVIEIFIRGPELASLSLSANNVRYALCIIVCVENKCCIIFTLDFVIVLLINMFYFDKMI